MSNPEDDHQLKLGKKIHFSIYFVCNTICACIVSLLVPYTNINTSLFFFFLRKNIFTFTFSSKSILTKCWSKLEFRSTGIDEKG